MQKSGLTLHAIASQEHVTPGYVSRLLRLSSLAPDIITAIRQACLSGLLSGSTILTKLES